MSNYGRDVLWDAATWADLDQAVSDEVNRVRVARKIFRTEDVSSATGAAPFWVSVAEITQLSMPETKARPFVDISVPFWLTVGQAEAEDTLHTGRTLARAAAKLLAMAEDHTIFRGGTPMPNAAVRTSNQNGLIGLAQQSGMQPRAVLPIAADNPADLHARPRSLLAKVNRGITDQTAAGWPGPYALILGAGLYTAASARLDPGSAETPAGPARTDASPLPPERRAGAGDRGTRVARRRCDDDLHGERGVSDVLGRGTARPPGRPLPLSCLRTFPVCGYRSGEHYAFPRLSEWITPSPVQPSHRRHRAPASCGPARTEPSTAST